MNREMWSIVAVVGLALASARLSRGADARSTEAQDRADVLKLAKEWDVAVAAHDTATADKVLLDDYVLVTGSGRMISKAELLKELASPTLVYQKNESSELSVRVHGDTAVVIAVLEQKFTDNGKAFDVPVRYTDTYVRTEKGWRQLSGHACRLPKTN